MNIEKYKYLKDGKYLIILDEKEYIMYEDVIIKNNILSKKKITQEELESYIKDNRYYEAYYKALKYINTKLRTTKEINKYLEKNNYEEKEIINVILKLKEDGYLNDKIYTDSYIRQQINLKNIGPLKIKKELLNLEIEEEIIDEYLKQYTKEEQYQKIEKMIKKEISLNKTKSKLMLKQKILINLTEKGFYRDDILEILEKETINDNEIYQREYEKIKAKLKEKYTGKELEYKIKEKLYQKGFKNI